MYVQSSLHHHWRAAADVCPPLPSDSQQAYAEYVKIIIRLPNTSRPDRRHRVCQWFAFSSCRRGYSSTILQMPPFSRRLSSYSRCQPQRHKARSVLHSTRPSTYHLRLSWSSNTAANILLSSNNEPVLVDFGFANQWVLTSDHGGHAFQTNLSWGTPEYLSPERATQNLHDERLSDIWWVAHSSREGIIIVLNFECRKQVAWYNDVWDRSRQDAFRKGWKWRYAHAFSWPPLPQRNFVKHIDFLLLVTCQNSWPKSKLSQIWRQVNIEFWHFHHNHIVR